MQQRLHTHKQEHIDTHADAHAKAILNPLPPNLLSPGCTLHQSYANYTNSSDCDRYGVTYGGSLRDGTSCYVKWDNDSRPTPVHMHTHTQSYTPTYTPTNTHTHHSISQISHRLHLAPELRQLHQQLRLRPLRGVPS